MLQRVDEDEEKVDDMLSILPLVPSVKVIEKMKRIRGPEDYIRLPLSKKLRKELNSLEEDEEGEV